MGRLGVVQARVVPGTKRMGDLRVEINWGFGRFSFPFRQRQRLTVVSFINLKMAVPQQTMRDTPIQAASMYDQRYYSSSLGGAGG